MVPYTPSHFKHKNKHSTFSTSKRMLNSQNGNSNNNNGSDNRGDLSSKFKISKSKRKSLIPLAKPNIKSQCTPTIPESIPVMAAGKSVIWAFRRNCRSIHSSSIPSKNDMGHTDEQVVAVNPSEGSLKPTSKVSLNTSSRLMEWKNDRISFRMEGNCITETLSSETVLNSCMWEKEKPLLKPEHWMVRLAIKASETAQGIRAYFLCPICNEPFSRPAIIACGHMHCMQCVCNWFEDNDSCPCCRYRIILKDANSTLAAKDFFESGFLLASIFSIGNFHVNIMQNIRTQSINDLDLDCPLSSTCSLSQQLITQFVTSAFKKIFRQECAIFNNTSDNKNNADCVKESHCFKAAIWFLRHGLQVAHLENFQELLKLEQRSGDDKSKEFFLRRVMTMKTPKNENDIANFIIPNSSLIEHSRKNPINGHDRQPRLRFRMPTMAGLGKVLLTAFIFIVILLAVYIMDDSYRARKEKISDSVNFYKMDFFVYFMTIFSMATYTETERIIFRRLQRMGNNNNGNRRRRRNHRVGRWMTMTL